jgi:hypothetical protein
MKATLKINKAPYILDTSLLKFEPKSAIYDTKEHSGTYTNLAEVTDNLVVAKYEYIDGNGNSLGTNNELPINAGKYTVNVVFSINPNHSLAKNYEKVLVKGTEISSKEEEFTINKASYELDVESLIFEPESVIYDGETHEAKFTNLPVGVSAQYEYFKEGTSLGTNILPSNAGQYTIKIAFEIEESGELYTNYSVVEVKDSNPKTNETEKTFTINPREITVIVQNASSIYGEEANTESWNYEITSKLTPPVIEKDGSIIELSIKNGNTVIYDKEVNNVSKTDAGTYEFVANCTNPNYIASITNAEYEITKKVPELSDLKVIMPEGEILDNTSDIEYSYDYDKEEKEVTVEAKKDSQGNEILKGLTGTINAPKYYKISLREDGTKEEVEIQGIPVDAGTYEVRVNISEGKNHKETVITICEFTIAPKELTKQELTYTIENTVITEGTITTDVIEEPWDGTEKEIEWNNAPHRVYVRLKAGSTILEGNTVNFKVLYNGEETVPHELGRYDVTVIGSGDNLVIKEGEPILIGTFEIKDTVKPVITLNGGQEVVKYLEQEYVDEGAVATDNHDEIVDVNVKIEKVTPSDDGMIRVEVESIDTSKVGRYEITYSAKDISNNYADEIVRTVIVRKESQITPTTSLSQTQANSFKITDKGFQIDITNEPYENGKISYIVTAGKDIITVSENGEVTFKDIGQAEVTVMFGETAHYASSTINIPILVNKGDLLAENFTVTENEYTYDGDKHTCTVTAFANDDLLNAKALYNVLIKNQDETDTKVYTLADGPVNAGRYNVFAVKENSLPNDWFNAISSELKIGEIVINKATYDISNVKFEDTSVTYDGNGHSIAVSGNLPEGVEVSYYAEDGSKIEGINAGYVNAGKYTITAKFTGDYNNYNEISDKSAKLTINPRPYTNEEIDRITMEQTQIPFDGKMHKFVVKEDSLPHGIEVDSYVKGTDEGSKIGTYRVKINLRVTDPNYVLPAERPSPITREVKITEYISAPIISYVTNKELNRSEGIDVVHENAKNPIVFSKITDIDWTKGSAIITKVDKNGNKIADFGSYAEPTRITLSEDGYYKIIATYKPNASDPELETVRFVRMARQTIRTEVIKGTEIDTDYYEGDIEIKISKLDNLQYLKLTIAKIADGQSDLETTEIDKVCTSDGNGNITINKPSGEHYELRKSGNDLILTLKFGTLKGVMAVDIEDTSIQSVSSKEPAGSITTFTTEKH